MAELELPCKISEQTNGFPLLTRPVCRTRLVTELVGVEQLAPDLKMATKTNTELSFVTKLLKWACCCFRVNNKSKDDITGAIEQQHIQIIDSDIVIMKPGKPKLGMIDHDKFFWSSDEEGDDYDDPNEYVDKNEVKKDEEIFNNEVEPFSFPFQDSTFSFEHLEYDEIDGVMPQKVMTRENRKMKYKQREMDCGDRRKLQATVETQAGCRQIWDSVATTRDVCAHGKRE